MITAIFFIFVETIFHKMPKNVISLTKEKENSLYWLGRYMEKVYLQIHNLCRCQELLDEGKPQDYTKYYELIGSSIKYHDKAEARSGLMYDSRNTESVITSIIKASEYAAKLEDELVSYNKYYIQQTLDLMTRNANVGKDPHMEDLQQAADLALAFWGSVDERIYDQELRSLLFVGKIVEHIVMCIKMQYKYYRIEEAFVRLEWIAARLPELFDPKVLSEISYLLAEPQYCPKVESYRKLVADMFNRLIKA